MEELVSEQLESIDKQKKRMKGKRGKTQKTSIYSQYGYESSGQANLISQASAIERKAKLKNQLEVNFRAMIKKYLDKDARTMIAEHE